MHKWYIMCTILPHALFLSNQGKYKKQTKDKKVGLQILKDKKIQGVSKKKTFLIPMDRGVDDVSRIIQP